MKNKNCSVLTDKVINFQDLSLIKKIDWGSDYKMSVTQRM